MKANFGQNGLSLSQQLLFLKKNPICTGSGTVKRGKLEWRFSVQPSPMSRCYQLRLSCEQTGAPDVFVETPDIEILARGRPLPHVYRDPLRLCLYLPSSNQWNSSKRFDQTIVPWTYSWLFYFEDWLAFGTWNGGGVHPGDLSEDRYLRRMNRRAC